MDRRTFLSTRLAAAMTLIATKSLAQTDAAKRERELGPRCGDSRAGPSGTHLEFVCPHHGV